MKKPPCHDAKVKPLACVWTAVHPNGEATPFFEVDTAGNQHFASVSVFSMSGFLGGLEQEYLELDLPITSKRIQWLESIFCVTGEKT